MISTLMPRLCCAVIACTAGVPTTMAQHAGDVYIEDFDGVIRTGGILEDSSLDIPITVFAATMNGSGFTSDPGFDTAPPMFQVGTRIGLNFLDTLHVWNGCGFEPTESVALRLSFFTVFADSGIGFAPGFDLAVEGNGGWHKHYTHSVRTVEDGTAPDAGIYMMRFELYSTDPSLDPSAPFWFIYNFNAPVAEHDQAIEWAIANVAQPPGCRADCSPSNGDGSTGNGIVNVDDLFAVVNAIGSGDVACDIAPANCDGTIGNGIVNVDDLFSVLNNFGVNCQ